MNLKTVDTTPTLHILPRTISRPTTPPLSHAPKQPCTPSERGLGVGATRTTAAGRTAARTVGSPRGKRSKVGWCRGGPEVGVAPDANRCR